MLWILVLIPWNQGWPPLTVNFVHIGLPYAESEAFGFFFVFYPSVPDYRLLWHVYTICYICHIVLLLVSRMLLIFYLRNYVFINLGLTP